METKRTRPGPRTASRRRTFDVTSIVAGAGSALVLSVIVYLIAGALGGDETAVTSTGTDAAQGEEVAGATSTVPTGSESASGDEGQGGYESTDYGSGDVESAASLTVIVDDPLALTEAMADTSLTLDQATGEVCWNVSIVGMESPYDGHIHVGPAGVKGGIVVDLGLLEGSNPVGCLMSTPVDVESIMADPAGHYVEFHDPDGVRTIRAQLAEATEGTMAMADSTAASEGGAVIVIEADRIKAVGEVPDQVTIDKLDESFADVVALGTVAFDSSELVIVEGSPRPSGRIRVEDAILFEVDSSDLADPNAAVLDNLATLFKARPAWRLTIVGHTDNTGLDVYNLELSLRRATAVRDALLARGVSSEVLAVEGAGSTEPIASNDTPQGKLENRRIEFEVQTG